MLVKVERLAREDILESAKYIAFDNPVAALRFLEAIEETSRLLGRQPKIGSPHRFSNTKLSNLRIWPVKKFKNFLIVYSAEEDAIKIMRILNTRRDFSLLFDF